MGKPMCSRLLDAGFSVHAWNRTPAKAEALRASGAVACVSAAEAVQGAAVVISMLQDGAAVGDTLQAAAAALAPGATWVDMSSTQHGEALSLHRQLEQLGCRFVDAPVSGGVAGAEAGTLAIMAGGAADDYARVEQLLSILGTPTLVGPAGSGQVAKLCNQLIVGGTLSIVAEALLLAQAAGADPAAVRRAIGGGFASSRILDIHGQRMLDRNFVPGGQVKSQLKDLRNVLVAASEAGLTLPVTSVVATHYERIEATHPRADHAAALLALEQINPGQRLGQGPDQLP